MSDLITVSGVNGYIDEDGTAWLNTEAVSRGLGFVQLKDGKEYVRWDRVGGYLSDMGFPHLVGKEFIPENAFYRLSMKGETESAKAFQALVADEILPSIRKTGSYTASRSNYSQSISPWHSAAIGEIRFAKEFAIAAGIRTERVLAVALARIEKETGKQLGDYRKTLPAPKEEDAEILNSGQIGERLIPPLKASNVNLTLEKMGFQQGLREPGKVPGTERLIKHNPWRLTDRGKEFGMMQDSAKQQGANKWEGFQIMWSSKTVDAVRDFLDRKSPLEEGED